MKIRSVIKVNKYKRFGYEPRYYDPVKEDLDIRAERVKKMQRENLYNGYDSGFRGAFRTNKKSSAKQLIRTYMVLLLTTTIFGWLYIGNKIFYITFSLALPPYVYWKIKQRRSRKE